MKFDEAIALAEGKLLNEEVLNEILYKKYVDTLIDGGINSIKILNDRIINSEGKPNKMRSFPHGELKADKSVTMPDCGGFNEFSAGVLAEIRKGRTKEEVDKLISPFNAAMADLKEKISKVNPPEEDK